MATENFGFCFAASELDGVCVATAVLAIFISFFANILII
jgi:hypothetical protein